MWNVPTSTLRQTRCPRIRRYPCSSVRVIGGKTYTLLRSLLSPTLPPDRLYDDIMDTLKKHYEPKLLAITERFHFHQWNQATGVSIADYVAELSRLSAHCKVGDYLDQALCDHLVCSLRMESIQKRLLAEADLTLNKALELAQGTKVTNCNAKSLKMPEPSVQKVSGSSTSCYRCGRSNHNPKECRFHDAECYCCKKKGHTASICRAKRSPKSGGTARKTSGGKNHSPRLPSTKCVDATQPETGEDDLHLYVFGERSSHTYYVDMSVNGN